MFDGTPSRRVRPSRSLALVGGLLLAVVAGLALLGSTLPASGMAVHAAELRRGPIARPARQAVTTTTDLTSTALPQGAGTSVVPAAVGTSQVPSAVNTAQAPGAVQTGVPSNPAAGNAAAAPPGQPAPATPATSNDGAPPWLWIIGGLLLLGILGGAVFMFTRRPATVVPVAPVPDMASAARIESAPAPAALAPAPAGPLSSEAPTAPVAAAALAAPVTTSRPTAAPTMVKCPNCDTMNPIDRRYCDECGQDLRAAVAAAMAGTLPEIEATTPYLETLSRADEQLEFVLARDAITVGRALDNDIVIDDQFIGWQTVSPRHAALQRTAEGFMLRDLGSENGTFVNSARTGENLLQDGMTIAFGKVEFIYRVPTE